MNSKCGSCDVANMIACFNLDIAVPSVSTMFSTSINTVCSRCANLCQKFPIAEPVSVQFHLS